MGADMKNRRCALAAMLVALCVVTDTVLAHHGFAGRYDEENPVSLDGVVI